MRYTMTFCEDDFYNLSDFLFVNMEIERAAYLLCKMCITKNETRLLVNEILYISDEDIFHADSLGMSIKQESYRLAMKKADQQGMTFVFVHSHPGGYPDFSEKDDIEEGILFKTAYNRIHKKNVVHASVLFSSKEKIKGRVWFEDNKNIPIECIRIIGNRFKFMYNSSDTIPEFFDRQVRAFGSDIQRLLGKLHIGIVGVGGTGSSVVEQLIRLGIGKLTIADYDSFEESNINRVYNSRRTDQGNLKVNLIKRLSDEIGLGTKINIIPESISKRSVIEQFRECDVIFGCTDDEYGRSILTKFAIYYMIPVFDMGVQIDSSYGIIKSIVGRITTLIPTTMCLFCRKRIDPENIRIESLEENDPEKVRSLRKEGYAPELKEPSPAVITFTTAIASSAINELLHRLTGFMGIERISSEIIHDFSDNIIRTNNPDPDEECFCGDRRMWGRGDVEPLLDIRWSR